MSQACPVCHHENTVFFHDDSFRSFYQCPNCKLVFVPSAYHLSPQEEQARYEHHENDPEDKGYRRFLKRFFNPMNEKLTENSEGLDFGAGPGPTLHLMFEKAGHTMDIYDLFFANNPTVFEKKYDFISATEVVEHLHLPMTDLNRLWHCLKPGGFLGLMTKMVQSKSAFENWHYIRDKTHISFFSKITFKWIARQWKAKCSFEGNGIVIFEKES